LRKKLIKIEKEKKTQEKESEREEKEEKTEDEERGQQLRQIEKEIFLHSLAKRKEEKRSLH
jgi:hypothetical protein